jgi:calmodulin
MSSSLDEDQLEELREAFAAFDLDSDGFLTVRELGRLFRQLGQNPTEAEILTMIQKKLDKNVDWKVSFDEFSLMMAPKMKAEMSEQDVREAFKVFDVDGKEVIAVAELCKVANNLGEELSEADAAEMIKSAKGGEFKTTMTVKDFIELMNPKN